MNYSNRKDAAFLPFNDPQHSNTAVSKNKIKYISGHSFDVTISINSSDTAYGKAERIYALFAPQSVKGIEKQRIGGVRDGGYVMLELDYKNQKDTAAYSFGVSDFAPWDLEFAGYGIDVFQYDGMIENPPQMHPKMHFHRFNIASRNPKENEKTVPQIINENGHQHKDLILQCDIEGAEWEIFETMDEAYISRFSQIIVEFHGLMDLSRYDYFVSVLEKINRTHQVYHVHANNCGSVSVLRKMILLPDVWEVSYVRRKDYEFVPCTESFPTKLDAANYAAYPDIFLGQFSSEAAGTMSNMDTGKSAQAGTVNELPYLWAKVDWISSVPSYPFAVHRNIKNDCYVSMPISNGGYEDYETTLFLDHVKDNSFVLDIGANIGWYSAAVLQKMKTACCQNGTELKVWAFEPHPGNFELLKRNTLDFPQHIRLFNAALGSRDGTADLFENTKQNCGDHGLAKTNERNGRKIPVQLLRLDSILNSSDTLPDLVKSDTQGSELDVFRGAERLFDAGWRPVIFCEFWAFGLRSMGHNPAELVKFIDKLQYRIFRVDNKRSTEISVSELYKFGSIKKFAASQMYWDLMLLPK